MDAMGQKPRATLFPRTLATCVSDKDYKTFVGQAKNHGLSVSSYLRGIIVDALADEAETNGDGGR